MASPQRSDRRSGDLAAPDQRSPFQLDRDRLLYSTEFRRLAGVTQVVSPGDEEIFHSRLTHTLKVAQIARRLAEKLLKDDKENGTTYAQDWGGIDPDVVESAALAHDLGHPPFGHLAESELNRLIREAVVRERHSLAPSQPLTPAHVAELKEIEGFEGNAQSFRILCELGIRRPSSPPGLDLTRATLNAALKYPTLFGAGKKKFGSYSCQPDKDTFEFARELPTLASGEACIEAQIMDWADDIAYSVHDVEDFYRAGRIPLDRLRLNTKERSTFHERLRKRRQASQRDLIIPWEEVHLSLQNFFETLIEVEGPYDGTRLRRQHLYGQSSGLIHTFINATTLREQPNSKGEGLEIDEASQVQVEFLKEMIWCYVIQNPSLAGHQRGQRTAIRTLFTTLDDELNKHSFYLLPPPFQERAEDLVETHGETIPVEARTRLVADAVASLTDKQALRLYQRWTASAQGSVLDPIVM